MTSKSSVSRFAATATEPHAREAAQGALAHGNAVDAVVAGVFAPALDLARPAKERGTLLRRIAQRGPSALAEKNIASELVHAAGRIAGGLLTVKDLEDLRPVLTAAAVQRVGGMQAALVAW